MSYLKWYLEKNKENPEGGYYVILAIIDFFYWLFNKKNRRWVTAFLVLYMFLYMTVFRLFVQESPPIEPLDIIMYVIIVIIFDVGILCVIDLFGSPFIKSYLEYRRENKKV